MAKENKKKIYPLGLIILVLVFGLVLGNLLFRTSSTPDGYVPPTESLLPEMSSSPALSSFKPKASSSVKAPTPTPVAPTPVYPTPTPVYPTPTPTNPTPTPNPLGSCECVEGQVKNDSCSGNNVPVCQTKNSCQCISID